MPDRDVPRVLVVNDDARVRHFLTTALGAAGFAVTATGSGEEGLRLPAERRSHEHQRAAEELRRRAAQSKAMVDVARWIPASLDLQGVLDRIVDEACLLLGARRVAIAVLEASEPTPIIRFRAVRGLSPAFAQRLRPLSWRDGTTPMAIHERRPVWTADVLRDPALELTPPTRAIIEAEGYRAVLSVPLLAGDRALGAIVVYRDLVGPFSEDDIDITQVF